MPPLPLLVRCAAACAAVLLCLGSGPPAAAEEPAADSGRYADIDRYVRGRMAEMGTPGLAYAVVGPDGPLHRRAWGTDGRGDPVTPETPFLWGSVAKPVAATAVMALVEQGPLDLDDPVTEWVPEFAFGGPGHASRVTVRHLLSQTSGLPEESAVAVADCDGDRCPRPAERVEAL
ncbi:beta-lactamase, partial [Murinocardiopsis flavida]